MRFLRLPFTEQVVFRACSLFLLWLCLTLGAAAATLNSWVKTGSGDWHDPTAWSLGILPAPDQTLRLTNQGWKAIAIGPDTPRNAPESLDVASVILGGNAQSFNVLLLNYAGFVIPLTTGSINVGTNSSITALSSVLNISTNVGTGGLTLESSFNQGESATVTADSLQIGTMRAAGIYNLTNGSLAAEQATVGAIASPFNSSSAFNQLGGSVLLNLLRLDGGKYILSGGPLTAGALELRAGGTFYHFDGTLTLEGLLTLNGGVWDEKAMGQEFGQLLLSSANGSNSTLQLPPGPCQLRFADSSSVAWSSQARLFIRGWNGSPAGDGQHQVVFGASSAGLTSQQLGLIQFKDPADTTGTFPARMLPTGEIVPGQFLVLQRTPSGLALSWGAGTLQWATNIAGPFQDVPAATSPYTVLMTEPREFFRLGP